MCQVGHANADVLVDTHWVGGDPGKGDVYGWASWSQRKAILALRNPSAQPNSISLDLGEIFELPPNAPRAFSLRALGRKMRPGRPGKYRFQNATPSLSSHSKCSSSTPCRRNNDLQRPFRSSVDSRMGRARRSVARRLIP